MKERAKKGKVEEWEGIWVSIRGSKMEIGGRR